MEDGLNLTKRPWLIGLVLTGGLFIIATASIQAWRESGFGSSTAQDPGQALPDSSIPSPPASGSIPDDLVPGDSFWQWQLTGLPVDRSIEADLYDIDLFENDARTVADLQSAGRKVVCYISAGSWEDWRPDADQFPKTVQGKD